MKKIYLHYIALVICYIVGIGSVQAQQGLFSDVGENRIVSTTGKRIIIPEKFRTLEANTVKLKEFLWTLPSEKNLSNRQLAPVMEFPMPDGSMAKFRVWESSIQEPELEAKFPEIKTFLGQGIDDPYATVRFDYNPYFGFSAQILSPNGRIYIDPYAKWDVNKYISYYHRDNKRNYVTKCGVTESVDETVLQRVAAGPCLGTQLRTYRLAVSCTGEYSAAVGAGQAGPTHAAIVTSTNRITGVYEVELSVRMILVANNNLIEYTNASTDPFTNTINSATLATNQSTTDLMIGSANYDIGHHFTSDDNGLASLNAVCGAGKARGATGSPQLIGDGFDIDYVAHEMGHQFGASHTFNSATCASAGGSYEPGGGTTIMAYAGICSPAENIQPNSDPIFHAISFDQIGTFISTGGGSNCAVVTPTGNTLPVISSVGTSNYNIPINTPFVLTGAATDADGDAITYNWEGWDIGAAGTWTSAASSTTRPLFRTRISKTTGSRSFPDIRVIAANYPGTAAPSAMDGLRGEVLPTVSRSMKFRLTVRDNRAGGGGIVSSGNGCQDGTVYQVNAVGTAAFVVTSPNGGQSYPGSSTQTVTWNVAGTDIAPINVTNVKILLSTDGGLTYPTVLAASTLNDGSESVTMPSAATTTARVRIEALGNIFFDISNSNFSITAAPVGFSFGTTTAATVSCNGPSTATVNLGTTANGGFSTPINLTAISGVPVGTTVSFSSNPLTPGNATDVILNNTNSLSNGTYAITIQGVAGAATQTTIVTYVVSSGAGPIITSQPQAVITCENTAANFSMAATGATAYQWQVNNGTGWSSISGATSNAYTIPNVIAAQNNTSYQCIATGQCNTSITDAALLTVQSSTAITTQPVNGAVCIGANTSFSVISVGNNLTYQWQYAPTCMGTFTNISNANLATFNLSNASLSDAGAYRVVVTGTCNSATSNCVELIVNTPISISTQPQDVSICLPTNAASFSVAATGSAINYQWQISTDGGTNYSNIANQNNPTLNLTGLTAASSGNRYRVVLSGPCNANLNSATAILVVNSPVAITSQPQDIIGCRDSIVRFSVQASGATITYQWQLSTDNGSNWNNITNAGIYSGVTSSILTINPVSTALNGNRYRVIVSGIPCGAVTSNAAKLEAYDPATVTLNTSSNNGLTPSDRTEISTTVLPSGSYSYHWYYNGILIPDSTRDRLVVSVDALGDYQVIATNNQSGCNSSLSNKITVDFAVTDALYIYPNPNSGQFNVRYYSNNTNTRRTLSIYDSKGARVYRKEYQINAPYTNMPVQLNQVSKGVYHIDIRDVNGDRLTTGQVVLQ